MLSAFEEFGSSDVDGSQEKITKAVSQKTNSWIFCVFYVYNVPVCFVLYLFGLVL